MENDIVVMSDIAAIMSKKSGLSEEICGRYVKELFLLAEDSLNETGEFVIDGIGKFYCADSDVKFVPDDSLSSELNSAFECFEPVEVADEVVEDIVNHTSEEVGEHQPAEIDIEKTVSVSGEANPDDKKTAILPPPIPDEDKVENTDNTTIEDADASIEINTTHNSEYNEQCDDLNLQPPVMQDYDNDMDSVAGKKKARFSQLVSFLLGLAFGVLVCIAIYFFFLNTPETGTKIPASEPKIESDTVAHDNGVLPVNKVDTHKDSVKIAQPVTDTENIKNDKPQYYKVVESSYLSNISRKYYGHYAFWIYIYIENKDKIADPDNLPIGVVLTIPAKEKYGINKDDKRSIERAEMKAMEMFGDK